MHSTACFGRSSELGMAFKFLEGQKQSQTKKDKEHLMETLCDTKAWSSGRKVAWSLVSAQ